MFLYWKNKNGSCEHKCFRHSETFFVNRNELSEQNHFCGTKTFPKNKFVSKKQICFRKTNLFPKNKSVLPKPECTPAWPSSFLSKFFINKDKLTRIEINETYISEKLIFCLFWRTPRVTPAESSENILFWDSTSFSISNNN